MKYSMTTPCDQCPFLQKMAHGFSMRRLREFASGEFPCHKTAKLNEDDLDGGYEATKDSVHCAGALIFNEKREQPHQMMRICARNVRLDEAEHGRAGEITMLPRRTNYQRKGSSFRDKPVRRPMSQRYLEDELDAIVRLILPYTETHCFTCSTNVPDLQVGHLLERRHRHTRWDTSIDGNNHLQCPKCNGRHESHPDIYRNKYIDRFGPEAYERLEYRARSSMKITYSELLDLLEEKEAQLKILQGKAA